MLAHGSKALSGRGTGPAGCRPALFLFFLDFHGFKIFGLEDLPAVQTFHIVDAVSPGKNLGAGVLTSGLHNIA